MIHPTVPKQIRVIVFAKNWFSGLICSGRKRCKFFIDIAKKVTLVAVAYYGHLFNVIKLSLFVKNKYVHFLAIVLVIVNVISMTLYQSDHV
jgi:hypothetical protein